MDAALDAYPRAAFVFNGYRELDSKGNTEQVWRLPLSPIQPGSALLEKMYFRSWRFSSPVWGTVMARRSAYLEAGLFDPRFGFVADVDMWLRLAERYEVAYIAEPLIGLPSPDAVPKSWKGVPAAKDMRRQGEKMFWEARVRHYHDRPVRLRLELIRHRAYVARVRVYRAGSIVKSWLRRVAGKVSGRVRNGS